MFDPVRLDPKTRSGAFRIYVAVSGVLPAVAIFGLGPPRRRHFRRRKDSMIVPPGYVFRFVWAVIAVLWAWVTLVVAFEMQIYWLVGFLVLHLLTAGVTWSWAWIDVIFGDVAAAWYMGLLMLVFTMIFALLECAEYDVTDAHASKAAAIFPWCVPMIWGVFALSVGISNAASPHS
jgi:tryptophan-rich sensory protein